MSYNHLDECEVSECEKNFAMYCNATGDKKIDKFGKCASCIIDKKKLKSR